MASSKPTSKRTALFLLIIILFTFLLGELGLRVVYHFKIKYFKKTDPGVTTEAYTNKSQTYYSYDVIPRMEYNTFLGYIPKSNFTGKGYRTNNVHFRADYDLSRPKEKNEVRIFVTGGSTAWGAGVRQDQLYSVLLEHSLKVKYPHHSIRVISAGVGAYCSTQERILIENMITSLSPDQIIMFSGWNDSYYGYRGVDILLNQDYLGYGLKLSGYQTQGTLAFDRISPPAYDDYFLKSLFLFAKSTYTLRYHSKETLSRDLASISLNPEEVVKTITENVHIISDLSKRHGFRFLLYPQPTLYATQKKLSAAEEALLSYHERNFVNFGQYNRMVYETYRRLFSSDAALCGYQFIDGDAAISGELNTVFVDQCHLGDRGNRLVASHLEEQVEKWLPDSDP